MQGGARQGIILLTLVSDSFRAVSITQAVASWHEIRWRFSVSSGVHESIAGYRIRDIRDRIREDKRGERISSRISEGTFRPPGNLFLRLSWRAFRPSVAWCFGVAKGAFWRLAAPPWAAPPAACSSSSRPNSCNRFVFSRIQKGVAWWFGVAKGAPAVPPAAAAAGAAGPAGPASPAAELVEKGVCLLVSCLSSHQQQQQSKLDWIALDF